MANSYKIYTVSDYKGRFNLLQCERTLVHKALVKSNWNVQEAMRLNGVVHLGDSAYRKLIYRHSIDLITKTLKDVPTISPSV